MVAFDLWVWGKKDEMSNKSPKGGVPPALSASQSKELPDSSPGLTPDVQEKKKKIPLLHASVSLLRIR